MDQTLEVLWEIIINQLDHYYTYKFLYIFLNRQWSLHLRYIFNVPYRDEINELNLHDHKSAALVPILFLLCIIFEFK